MSGASPDTVLQQHSKLLNFLQTLLPDNIDDKDKFSATDFTRKRIFTIDFLTFCIIYLISDQNRFGYKHILQTLWKKLRDIGFALSTALGPSGAAFCKARKKLPAKMIKDMFHRVIDLLAQFKPNYRWKGHRLFAIDGMRIQLPASEELREHFDSPRNKNGTVHYPQALISKLCCVLTDVVYNFTVAPYLSSEREIALSHLNYLKPSDILIADRGYPSYELFWELMKRGIEFIMRVHISSTWTVVKRFLESGKKEQIVTIKITKNAKRHYKNDPTVPQYMTIRLVRITLSTGETEVLMTSLLDTKKYAPKDFKMLYHWRWPIEETCKSVKHHQFIENFHSKDVNGIYQEINAHYLLMAITRLFMLQAEAKTPDRVYGLSYKSAVQFVSDQLPVLLLIKDEVRLIFAIHETLNMITKMYEKPRAERSYPRQLRASGRNSYKTAASRDP